MAVFYKLYQGKNEKSGTAGKWYARAAIEDNVNTETLAEAIEEKCTVHSADVVAVIKALVGEMTKNLQAGKRVVLDGFGAFKVGIKSSGADSRDKFSVRSNISGLRIIFQPEVHIDRTDGKRTKTFLSGTVVKEYGKYDSGDTATTSDDGQNNG